MKVFLDTNILFSAILFPGSIPDKALQKLCNSHMRLLHVIMLLMNSEEILQRNFHRN